MIWIFSTRCNHLLHFIGTCSFQRVVSGCFLRTLEKHDWLFETTGRYSHWQVFAIWWTFSHFWIWINDFHSIRTQFLKIKIHFYIFVWQKHENVKMLFLWQTQSCATFDQYSHITILPYVTGLQVASFKVISVKIVSVQTSKQECTLNIKCQNREIWCLCVVAPLTYLQNSNFIARTKEHTFMHIPDCHWVTVSCDYIVLLF